VRALSVMLLGMSAAIAATACSNGERAQRDREIATLRSQVEDIRKGLDANNKELARLSGEMKALDAQSAFVVGEVKASAEDRTRVKASIEDNTKALRALQSAVDGLSKPTASPSTSAPLAFAADATPDQIYAAGLASLQADEYEPAVSHSASSQAVPPGRPCIRTGIGEAPIASVTTACSGADGVDVHRNAGAEALLKVGLCYRAAGSRVPATAWERVVRVSSTTARTGALALSGIRARPSPQ
jgi:hypothetical protein